MKHSRFTASCLTVLTMFFCACAKEAAPVPEGGASVVFDIDVSSVKAQTSAEMNINMLQIGIYNKSGELEWENTYGYSFTAVKTISGLTPGTKTLVAVANKNITMPATLDAFHSVPVYLNESRRDAFVMYGIESAEASIAPSLTTIHMQRTVAKITVRSSISIIFEDGKTHEWFPERIYVANVATRTNLRGDAFSEFTNLRESREQSSDAVIRDFTVAENSYWINGGVFNHGVDFYVCPNNSQERPTTMIIEARYDGRQCYYPLVIATELLSNTMYRSGAITVTCEGMPNPGDEFTSLRVKVNYQSDDWKVGETAQDVVF